ncbi:LysR family transcriptional regulator [Nocardioides humilatus]|uniref:LysR family transcriptional regulator n=1 Tax=Nocardioides humilatus TaxID=2607660 RepID=A0A5B1LG22_9ACTN|nr:LysR family transcriptional regulator [Nocardioides humilatus]KAA1418629.1 LysR family transcriptional regulator [Nocardioides humilatus]
MNIQQLTYLVETAETGSMTAAAAQLYVAQPALSRAVRALERELGVTVFARSARGVRVTSEGEVVVAKARRVLRSLAVLQQAGDGTTPAAPFTIAASPTLQAAVAIPILRALDDHGLSTSSRLLGTGGAATVHELVRSGRADLGICDQTIETDLAVIPVGRVEVRFVSPAAVDLPDPVPLADLAGVPLVLPTLGSDRRAALDAFFAALGIEPVVAVESDERSVWMEAVLHGLASCLWHSLDGRWLPPGAVTVRSLEPALWQEVSVVHRPGTAADDPRLEVVRRFAELVAVRSSSCPS